jgi:beta-glucosidase
LLTEEIGVDFWHTYAIPRLNVPSIRMSDGPNGIRGTKFFGGVPVACFPCGTGLRATWDSELMEAAGRLMAEESRAKGAAAILGPTVNIQRSPLGGRGFESFSEDPYLAGSLAAAEIRGIQESGIQATIKHFVCNDLEHERKAVDSIVSERALREIYLMPFQIAMRDADPKAFMTSYNKLNGLHCSENKRLLQGVLRDEWGFKGMVMSDCQYSEVFSNEMKSNISQGSVLILFQKRLMLDSILKCQSLLFGEVVSSNMQPAQGR